MHDTNKPSSFSELEESLKSMCDVLVSTTKPRPFLHEDTTTIELVAGMLRYIFGDEVWDDSPEDTARRVLKTWLGFAPQAEPDFEFTVFDSDGINQMIIVRDIEFSSLCAHHLLPFSGLCHIGYLPNKKQAGLSKFPRLVEFHANRPHVQETLTRNIATDVKNRLEAQGVAVMIESRHTCMSCRGIRARNASMITSEMRGTFLTGTAARDEFLALIGRERV